MKAASISQLKNELKILSHDRLLELCMSLAKFRKENKEMLSYLLFEADNEDDYVKSVKEMIAGEFEEVHPSNIYLAKKTIRKVLRHTSKYIKYSGNKQTEIELLIFFCKKLKSYKSHLRNSPALVNLYLNQLKKIEKALSALHEDLQYDYKEMITELR